MRKQNLFFILFVTFLLSGCSTQKLINLSYSESSARVIEPIQGVVLTPLIADIEVISSHKITPFIKTFNDVFVNSYVIANIIEYKKVALCEAAKQYDADVIVAALIDVITTDEGKLQIVVTGYPAKFTNFRKSTKDDVWMTDMYQTILNTPITNVVQH